ncbi:transcriptional regulator protein YdcR [Escherichia coli]|uniref:Transcriptional regulator protein YdcR n=1 Tax=Escherichia coli TaxID=562 RepID=A0A376MWY7_ECOLX|nr:transcriptional regulator protein YdcR [Escherichia coli]
MKKYQQLAEQLREQIASGIWQPGDRLPSLRDQVALSGMSFMTVSHAYQLLGKSGIYYRATAVGLLRCTTGNKNAESASHSCHSR